MGRPRRPRIRVRQRGSAPPRLSGSLPARLATRHERRIPRLHRRRRLLPARALALRRLERRATEGWEAPLYWERSRRVLAHDARRASSSERVRAGLPRELLRSRRVRPLGRRPPSHRIRVGDRSVATRSPRATSSKTATSTRDPPRMARDLLSVSATSGNGLRAPTRPTRVCGRPRARSANTTRSSCATSSCSAAARVRPRLLTSGRPTEISSLPRLAGSSPESAWRKTMTTTHATISRHDETFSWRRRFLARRLHGLQPRRRTCLASTSTMTRLGAVRRDLRARRILSDADRAGDPRHATSPKWPKRSARIAS